MQPFPAHTQALKDARMLAPQPLREVRRRGTEFDAEEPDHRPDFIERLVVGIFGKKVLDDQEPMGMKRMGYEEFPEVYPATTTEFAAPVEGDDAEVALFRPLLARTQLEEKELMLCYSAEECGWDPDAFHRSVDSMGAAVRALPPTDACSPSLPPPACGPTLCTIPPPPPSPPALSPLSLSS